MFSLWINCRACGARVKNSLKAIDQHALVCARAERHTENRAVAAPVAAEEVTPWVA